MTRQLYQDQIGKGPFRLRYSRRESPPWWGIAGMRWDGKKVFDRIVGRFCDGIVGTSKCGRLYGAWIGYRHERNIHVALSRLVGQLNVSRVDFLFQFVIW